jgi:hypothetical protein
VCSLAICKVLVEQGGAKVDVLNDDDWSPAAVAAQRGFSSVVLWLCEHVGADPLRAVEAAACATPPCIALVEVRDCVCVCMCVCRMSPFLHEVIFSSHSDI